MRGSEGALGPRIWWELQYDFGSISWESSRWSRCVMSRLRHEAFLFGGICFEATDVLGSGHRKSLVQDIDSVLCRVQVSTFGLAAQQRAKTSYARLEQPSTRSRTGCVVEKLGHLLGPTFSTTQGRQGIGTSTGAMGAEARRAITRSPGGHSRVGRGGLS